MSTPGASSLIRSRIFARISSRCVFDSGFMLRMYSPTLTGDACSSISARPVRRTKCRISPSGLFVRFLHRLEHCVDRSGNLIGRIERRSRRQRDVDLNAAFVERRQKVPPKLRHLPAGDADGKPSQNQQRPGKCHAQSDQRTSPTFSIRAEESYRLHGEWHGISATGSTTTRA